MHLLWCGLEVPREERFGLFSPFFVDVSSESANTIEEQESDSKKKNPEEWIPKTTATFKIEQD